MNDIDINVLVLVQFINLQFDEIFGSIDFNLDVIFDVLVMLLLEVGCVCLLICNFLQFNQGLVVELECGVGELLDVFVNGILIVYGEVVVINDCFGVCLIDVVSLSEWIWRLC